MIACARNMVPIGRSEIGCSILFELQYKPYKTIKPIGANLKQGGPILKSRRFFLKIKRQILEQDFPFVLSQNVKYPRGLIDK